MASCFGKVCAPAASKQPVKRYNMLVLNVFPKHAPPVRKPLEIGIIRKIAKVQEYVSENLQRAPKVSRRLYRRILSSQKTQSKLGYVKIAVHAYIALLAKGKPQDSSLLAKELIGSPSATIPVLMAHPSSDIQALALELLAHFIKVQEDADFFQPIEELISKTGEYAMPGARAETNERLCAALRAMREFVALLERIARGSSQVDIIQATALRTLGTPRPQDVPPRALDVAAIEQLQLAGDFTSDDASALSEGVLHNVASLSVDPAIGKQVVARTLMHMDESGLWRGKPVECRALQIVQGALDVQRLRMLLFTGLLTHAGSSGGFHPEDRAAVVALAAEETKRLEPPTLFASLVRSIDLLAPILPADADSTPESRKHPVYAAVAACLGALTHRMQSIELPLEAMSASLEKQKADAAIRAHCLSCLLMIAEATTHLAAPSSRSGTSPAPPVEHFPHLLLQELVVVMSTGTVQEQALANRIFITLLPLFRQPLKVGHVEQVQDALFSQLQPTTELSPQQLASAANAVQGLVRYGEPATLSRTCQLLLCAIKQGLEPKPPPGKASERVALLKACHHAARTLQSTCSKGQLTASILAPVESACPSLRARSDGSLEATSTAFDGDEAGCLALLNTLASQGSHVKFCSSLAEQVAASSQPRGSVTSKQLQAGFTPSANPLAPTTPGGLPKASPVNSAAMGRAFMRLGASPANPAKEGEVDEDSTLGERAACYREATSMKLNDALDALTALSTGFEPDTAAYSTPWSQEEAFSMTSVGVSAFAGPGPPQPPPRPKQTLPHAMQAYKLDSCDPMLPISPPGSQLSDLPPSKLSTLREGRIEDQQSTSDAQADEERPRGATATTLPVGDPLSRENVEGLSRRNGSSSSLPARSRRRALHVMPAGASTPVADSSRLPQEPLRDAGGVGTDAAFADAQQEVFHGDSDDDFRGFESDDEFNDAKSTLSRQSFRSAVSGF